MVVLITNNHDPKLTVTPRPKLSMIWEKESDGGYQCLFARWVAVGEECPSASNDERLLARVHNLQPLNR